MNIKDEYIHGNDGRGVVKSIRLATSADASTTDADGAAILENDILYELAEKNSPVYKISLPSIIQNTIGGKVENASKVTVTNDITTNTDYPLIWVKDFTNSADASLYKSVSKTSNVVDGRLLFNPSSGYLKANGFVKYGSNSNKLLLGDGNDIDKVTSISNESTDSLIPTAKSVYNAISSGFAANDAMIYKGTYTASASSAATVDKSKFSNQPDATSLGWTWVVSGTGFFGNIAVEPGDMIIAKVEDPGTTITNYNIVQTNLVNAITKATVETNGNNQDSNDTRYLRITSDGKLYITQRFSTSTAILGNSATATTNIGSTAVSNPFYNLITDSAVSKSIQFEGGDGIGVAGVNSKITITNTGVRNVTCPTTGTNANKIVVNTNGTETTISTILNAINASNAAQVNNALTIKLGNGGTEGTNEFTFNGSAAKVVTITPALIGASDPTHTHSVKINGNTKTVAASGGTAVDLGTYATSIQVSKAINTSNGTATVANATALADPYITLMAADSLLGNVQIKAGTSIGIAGTAGIITITNTGVRSVTAGTGDNINKIAVNTNGSTTYIDTILNAINASNAALVANSLTIKLNGGTTEGTNLFTFNGSAAKTLDITPQSIGASDSDHQHKAKINGAVKTTSNSSAADTAVNDWGYYATVLQVSKAINAQTATVANSTVQVSPWISLLAGSTVLGNIKIEGDGNSVEGTAGNIKIVNTGVRSVTLSSATGHINSLAIVTGTNTTPTYIDTIAKSNYADSAGLVTNSLVIKLNGGTVEGTSLFTYNGSNAKTIDITSSVIGALSSAILSNSSGTAATSTASANSNYLYFKSGTSMTSKIALVAGSGIAVGGKLDATNSYSLTITNTGVRNIALGTGDHAKDLVITKGNNDDPTYIALPLTEADGTITSTKTLTVTSWTTIQDISSYGSGTYAIQITNGNVMGSGVFSLVSGQNNSLNDEIPLHVSNTTANGWRPYARISAKNLQLATNEATGTSRAYTIKIKKLL